MSGTHKYDYYFDCAPMIGARVLRYGDMFAPQRERYLPGACDNPPGGMMPK
jgi:hypothetical protein